MSVKVLQAPLQIGPSTNSFKTNKNNQDKRDKQEESIMQ